MHTLHVEYAERRIEYGILFIFSPFYEYNYLGYIPIHSIYRLDQAEYVIRILVAASQECVNTYSTRWESTLTPVCRSLPACLPSAGDGPSIVVE